MDFEQRANIKFCFALEKTFVETFQMMKTVWGDDVKRSTVHLWYKRFKGGRRSIQDDPQSERPVTARDPDHIFCVCELVRADRRLSVRDLVSMIGLSIGTVHSILSEDPKMSRICAKFVPKILNNEIKEIWKMAAQEMLDEEVIPIFCQIWWWGTNHRFTHTIPKWKCSPCSEKFGMAPPPIRRKAAWKDHAWNQCWSSFLISKGYLVGIFTPRCDCEFRILRWCADKIARSHLEKNTWKMEEWMTPSPQ